MYALCFHTQDLVCTNGMEVDLNYSLLPDGIVAGGDAWRNPSTKALLMYTDSSVTKSKAVVSKATVKDCPQFATDAYEGFAVMDVGQFEELDAAVCARNSALLQYGFHPVLHPPICR